MKKVNEKKLYTGTIKSFTKRDKEDDRLNGVLHKDGYLYAGTAHMIIRVQYGYPKEKEGIAIDRVGNIVEKPVVYESVITEPDMYGEVMSVEGVEKLRIAAKNIYRAKRKGFDPLIDIGLGTAKKYGYSDLITYSAAYLKHSFDLFDLLKEQFEIYHRKATTIYSIRLIFKSLESNTIVEFMPHLVNSYDLKYKDNVFTIDEAIKYQKQ